MRRRCCFWLPSPRPAPWGILIGNKPGDLALQGQEGWLPVCRRRASLPFVFVWVCVSANALSGKISVVAPPANKARKPHGWRRFTCFGRCSERDGPLACNLAVRGMRAVRPCIGERHTRPCGQRADSRRSIRMRKAWPPCQGSQPAYRLGLPFPACPCRGLRNHTRRQDGAGCGPGTSQAL